MKRLYAPWRAAYVKKNKEHKPACPFCSASQQREDEANLVLFRNEHIIVMLNKYPYNTGHLLIIPHEHKAELAEVSCDVRAALIEAASEWTEILRAHLKCQGFNIGFNLGTVSGGSIPEHLHMHVLPRWQGDTNFLTTLAETKLVSFSPDDLYHALASFGKK